VRKISQSILRAVSDAVSSATAGAPGLVGVTLDRYGKASFDRAKFLDAYAKDPAGVEKMFTQSGSSTSGDVSFVGAGDRAAPGSYEVVATSFATQATSTGLAAMTWPADAEQVVKVRIGTNEISHTIQIGDTAADVAADLQAAFGGAGLALTATEAGGGVEIRTNAVGSNALFEVAWDGATWAASLGTNATGTIGGVAAVGIGNTLTVPSTTAELGGLAAELTGSTLGSVGSITYVPGIAQRLASAVSAAIDPVSGLITSARQTRQNRIDQLNTAIASYEVRLLKRETLLKKQYAALETALGSLKSQSEWLAGQLSGLSASSSSSK
jgi:flagellar hook-associated protein 2